MEVGELERKKNKEQRRKRKENKVLRYYCYGLIGLVFFLILTDFIIASAGGEGAISLLQGIVNNFSGD